MPHEKNSIIPTPLLNDQFDKGKQARAELRVWTYKYEGRMITSVRIQFANDGFTTVRMGRDFSVRAAVTEQRATVKNIEAQHAAVVARLADWVITAHQHYNVAITRELAQTAIDHEDADAQGVLRTTKR